MRLLRIARAGRDGWAAIRSRQTRPTFRIISTDPHRADDGPCRRSPPRPPVGGHPALRPASKSGTLSRHRPAADVDRLPAPPPRFAAPPSPAIRRDHIRDPELAAPPARQASTPGALSHGYL